MAVCHKCSQALLHYFLCLQDMSSEGPLSSAEEPVNRMQAHATSAPVEQHDADGQREASVSDRENETDEEDTGHSSLLSLDPETAQAAQDVLDSEPEVCSSTYQSSILVQLIWY